MATTADVTIVPRSLVPGAESIDLVGAGASVTAAQTFMIPVSDPEHTFSTPAYPPARGGETKLLLVVEEGGGGAATISILSGDTRTSLQSIKGLDSIALATSDLKLYMLEAGRHLTNDGFIKGLVNTQTCKILAFILPAGY